MVALERTTVVGTNSLVVVKVFVDSISTGIEITTFDIIGTVTIACIAGMLKLVATIAQTCSATRLLWWLTD